MYGRLIVGVRGVEQIYSGVQRALHGMPGIYANVKMVTVKNGTFVRVSRSCVLGVLHGNVTGRVGEARDSGVMLGMAKRYHRFRRMKVRIVLPSVDR